VFRRGVRWHKAAAGWRGEGEGRAGVRPRDGRAGRLALERGDRFPEAVLGLDRAEVPAEAGDVDRLQVGVGRIAVSETEAPNIIRNSGVNRASGSTTRQRDRAPTFRSTQGTDAIRVTWGERLYAINLYNSHHI
jgi:hypothetical protein